MSRNTHYPHYSRLKLALSLLFVCMLFSTPALALKSDREQAIHIESDRVEIKEKEEISHYTGHVYLTQGTLKITADDVKVILKDGELNKIIIKGKPAKIEQKPDENQQLVQSEALHIEYFAGEEYLLLKENALWQQGENHISGNVLEYYTRTSTVKARKTEGDEDARVQAVIQPKKNKANNETE